MRAVLDTSVLIGAGLTRLEGDLAISAVSLAQLNFGVLAASDPAVRAERLRRLTGLQRRFDALPVDDEVASSYGELAAAVVAAGRRPSASDLLVAATAHAHSARLYTRNASALVGLETHLEIVSV